MKNENSVENIYRSRLESFAGKEKTLKQTSGRIGVLRLVVFLLGLGGAIWLFRSSLSFLLLLEIPLAIGFFLFLVLRHNKIEEEREFMAALIKVNDDSLARITGKWTRFPEKGDKFFPESHSFAGDLDIAGPSSLYQYICTAETFPGKKELARTLGTPELDAGKIREKQEAVAELAEMLEWRQWFQGTGKTRKGTGESPLLLEPPGEEEKKSEFFISHILPFFSLGAGLFSALVYHFYAPGLFLLLVHILILGGINKKLSQEIKLFEDCRKDLKSFTGMLKLYEEQSFTSTYLKNEHPSIPFSRQVKTLQTIMNASDIRYNALYFVVNFSLLWDYRILFALRRWRRNYGSSVARWTALLGKLECLCSFAQIKFNNRGWPFPDIREEKGIYAARNLGHPLIDETKRVGNDVDFSVPGTIHIITGSNMSGKSTWLRTLGINMVLAYNGAPVCGDSCELSLFNLFTVMRITDDLETGTSSFYAELKRIKSILEAEEQDIFFLLDEIFKGTNSIDRHTGARVLCLALSRRGASGLVSTHDLDLGKLEQENGKIKNFHFREYYEDNKLLFDYSLYPGISETRNALFLMKMMGMEELPL